MNKFIFASISIAILGGFLLGAHIVFPIGFNFKLPNYLDIWIQTHAHLQLVGWFGLFIIGMSLYFLPKLGGIREYSRETINLIFYLVFIGLLLASSSEFSIPYLKNIHILKISCYIGVILETIGILIYICEAVGELAYSTCFLFC